MHLVGQLSNPSEGLRAVLDQSGTNGITALYSGHEDGHLLAR